MEDRHLSLSEVAEVMEVTERTVRRWIKSGRLKAYKPGRDYRIPESAVKEFIERSEARPKVSAPLPEVLERKEWERRRSRIMGLTLEATELRKRWAKELQDGGLAEHRAMEISFAITGVLESAESQTILGGLERTDKANAKQVKRLREELERLIGLLKLSVEQVSTGVEFKSIIDGVVFEEVGASHVETARRTHA